MNAEDSSGVGGKPLTIFGKSSFGAKDPVPARGVASFFGLGLVCASSRDFVLFIFLGLGDGGRSSLSGLSGIFPPLFTTLSGTVNFVFVTMV